MKKEIEENKYTVDYFIEKLNRTSYGLSQIELDKMNTLLNCNYEKIKYGYHVDYKQDQSFQRILAALEDVKNSKFTPTNH